MEDRGSFGAAVLMVPITVKQPDGTNLLCYVPTQGRYDLTLGGVVTMAKALEGHGSLGHGSGHSSTATSPKQGGRLLQQLEKSKLPVQPTGAESAASGGPVTKASPVLSNAGLGPIYSAKSPPALSIGFPTWLMDEVVGRSDYSSIVKRLGRTAHLEDMLNTPWQLEKCLGIGFILCLDVLLHELTFMPLNAFCGIIRYATTGTKGKSYVMSPVEKSECYRTALLIANAIVIGYLLDFSYLYHYIRSQSFMKLYIKIRFYSHGLVMLIVLHSDLHLYINS